MFAVVTLNGMIPPFDDTSSSDEDGEAAVVPVVKVKVRVGEAEPDVEAA
jgi:hypothetical protein